MNANAKEEELQQRLERIRVQNAELLQRYQVGTYFFYK